MQPQGVPSVLPRLYHNLGNAKSEDVTECSGFGAVKGMGIAIADNNHGRMDVYIANETEPNFLIINCGNGKFEEVALEYGVAFDEGASPVSAMGANANDYDNDGGVDLFYNNLMGQTWRLYRNRAGTIFDYDSQEAGLAVSASHFPGEHRLHRLQQRWVERYRFGQRRRRQS